jgi:hypothetical protein
MAFGSAVIVSKRVGGCCLRCLCNDMASQKSYLSLFNSSSYVSCAENAGCQDLKICAFNRTTSFDYVSTEFKENVVVIKSGELIEGFIREECNVIAGGLSDVCSSSVKVRNYTAGCEKVVVRDPLALVTRQDDPQWSAFVYWIVSATFYAEENGISLATSSKMPVVNLLGPAYTNMFRHAIGAVGSCADIYKRNIEQHFRRSGLNLLNGNQTGPQHCPLPGLD